MDELMRIRTDAQGARAVSARELHEFLDSKQQFTNWIDNKIIKYDFVEGEDYVPHKVFNKSIKNPSEVGRPKIDYIITLDMAKELAMLESNKKGQQARKYFIAVEKKFRDQRTQLTQVPQNFAEALQLAADQQRKLLEAAPKVEVYDTITNSNKLSNVSEVSALFNMGRNQLYQWLRDQKIVQTEMNKPYQRYIDSGHFDFKIETKAGRSCYMTLITGKGIAMIGHLLEQEDHSF